MYWDSVVLAPMCKVPENSFFHVLQVEGDDAFPFNQFFALFQKVFSGRGKHQPSFLAIKKSDPQSFFQFLDAFGNGRLGKS